MNAQKLIYHLRKTKGIRLLLYPIMQLKLFYQKQRFWKSKDAEIIRSLHNTHVGERCYVIGNGPSLTADDLMKLKNEFCFGTNRIFYMFNQVDWRPDIYMCSDNDILLKELSNIKSMDLNYKFVNLSAKKYGRSPKDRLCYFNLFGPFKINKELDVQTEVSKDVSKYFSKTRTITCSCIEMAIYMGFKEINLLGVDHSYAITQYSDGRIVKDSNVKNYFNGMTGGEAIAVHPIDKATECYRICEEYSKCNGIHIYNVTRGGKLEIFERKNFDELFYTEMVSVI